MRSSMISASCLDNVFILRFDIADAMRLTDDLDDVIDGMRKIAFHIDIYKGQVGKLRPDALELFGIGERMLGGVRELVGMLSEPRLSLTRVRNVANQVDAAEAEADELVAMAERRLVAEFSPPAPTASSSGRGTSSTSCSSK